MDPRKQVTVKEYPPNCTSKHQQMDQGVIAAWKKLYKTELLKVRVDTIKRHRSYASRRAREEWLQTRWG